MYLYGVIDMRFLKRFNSILLKLAGWSVMFFIASIAVIIPYEVFGRYVLGNMEMWANEFSQYALVWASMMGGAVGLKRGYQVGITTLIERLPSAPAKVVQASGYAAMLVFLAFMTYYGMVQTIINQNQTSSTLGISMSIPYAALPVGFFIMFFLTVEQLADFLHSVPAGRQ